MRSPSETPPPHTHTHTHTTVEGMCGCVRRHPHNRLYRHAPLGDGAEPKGAVDALRHEAVVAPVVGPLVLDRDDVVHTPLNGGPVLRVGTEHARSVQARCVCVGGGTNKPGQS